MKRWRKTVRNIAVGLGVLTGVAFIPVSETIEAPRSVTLKLDDAVKASIGLSVVWYDLGLAPERFNQEFAFDDESKVQVPELKVPTRLWRLGLKRVLSMAGKWSACEHCTGPTAILSPYLREKYDAPDSMRLTIERNEADRALQLTVRLILDETKFATRPFVPRDAAALVAEAKALLSGSEQNIDPERFGPELKEINPVRVERHGSALILWMGGKIGYALAPDSKGIQALNLAMMGTTKYEHIYEIKRF